MLTSLTDYNVWSNKRICAAIFNTNVTDVDQPVESSFTTLRKSIYHIWDAQIIWLSRLNGYSPSGRASAEYAKDFAGIDLHFINQSEDFAMFVKMKSESFLENNCRYKTLKGNEYTHRVWQIILHCMNHATYHRGQIITMLHQLQLQNMISTDYIEYVRET